MKDKINDLREKLTKKIIEKGTSDKEVIQISTELDKLIIEYEQEKWEDVKGLK